MNPEPEKVDFADVLLCVLGVIILGLGLAYAF